MPEQACGRDDDPSVHAASTMTIAMVKDALIRLAFDDCAILARRHAIGGVLTDIDCAGLYRRVARDHDTTTDRVAYLCADR